MSMNVRADKRTATKVDVQIFVGTKRTSCVHDFDNWFSSTVHVKSTSIKRQRSLQRVRQLKWGESMIVAITPMQSLEANTFRLIRAKTHLKFKTSTRSKLCTDEIVIAETDINGELD